MKNHKVSLSKTQNLIDVLRQCVDFIHGQYGVRPSVLKHNNGEAIKECAYSSLRDSSMSRASVQKLYGMDVVLSTDIDKNCVIMGVQDRSTGKIVNAVQITLYDHGDSK